jgi:hypothetical protein
MQSPKRVIGAALLGVAVLFSAGCATDDKVQTAYYEYLKAEAEAKKEVGKARYNAEAVKHLASAMALKDADSSAKAAGAVSIALAGNSSRAESAEQSTSFGVKAPESMGDKAFKWASLLVNGVAPWWVQDRNGQRQAEVQIVNSDNQAKVQMSTNSTMLGLGLGREAFQSSAPTLFSTDTFTIDRPEPKKNND